MPWFNYKLTNVLKYQYGSENQVIKKITVHQPIPNAVIPAFSHWFLMRKVPESPPLT